MGNECGCGAFADVQVGNLFLVVAQAASFGTVPNDAMVVVTEVSADRRQHQPARLLAPTYTEALRSRPRSKDQFGNFHYFSRRLQPYEDVDAAHATT